MLTNVSPEQRNPTRIYSVWIRPRRRSAVQSVVHEDKNEVFPDLPHGGTIVTGRAASFWVSALLTRRGMNSFHHAALLDLKVK